MYGMECYSFDQVKCSWVNINLLIVFIFIQFSFNTEILLLSSTADNKGSGAFIVKIPCFPKWTNVGVTRFVVRLGCYPSSF